MLDVLDGDEDANKKLDRISTYQTAIRSLASVIFPNKLHVVGYLKDGRRVITPFNRCWYSSHEDDVKFDSKTEYDWREEKMREYAINVVSQFKVEEIDTEAEE